MGRTRPSRHSATYRADFGEFLAGANPFLDAAAFETMLASHTDHLTQQVVAYHDQGYAEAYEIGRHGYAQTSELAAGLGGAIADQFPQLFPDAAMPKPSERHALTRHPT